MPPERILPQPDGRRLLLTQTRRSLWGMMKSGVAALLLLFVGVLPGPAHGQNPGFTGHLSTSPQDQLDEAVRLYQTGAHDDAKRILTSLVNDPGMDDEGLRQRARVYLGEVLYLKGDKEEARRLFEAVLLQDHGYVVDPFAHPPDVRGFFETIRAYIRPAAPPTPPTTSSAPVSRPPFVTYTGFGVYQFQSGRPGLGTAMAGAQATLGALSLASFYGLTQTGGWETEDQKTALDRRRALQWGATAGFYGVWMWSVIDAHRHWRSTHQQSAQMSARMLPTPDGRGLGVTMTAPLR